MAIVGLELLQFRNYDSLSLELPAEGALFCGKNGVGKTNVLEAMSLVTLGKSVRACAIKEVIQKEKEELFVKASFAENGTNIVQSVGFSKLQKFVIEKNGTILNNLSQL